MIAFALSVFLSGFALFLLGFSIFMYYENRKFGDNQFTVKLLPPPPPRMAATVVDGHAKAYVGVPSGFVRDEKPASILSQPA